MKTHGHMILVRDVQLGYFKPIDDPWYFSKTSAEMRLMQLQKEEETRPISERYVYIVAAVKG